MTSLACVVGKDCAKCGVPKPTSQFSLSTKRAGDHLHSWCRDCTRQGLRDWPKQNREKDRQKSLRSYRANRDERLSYAKARYAKSSIWPRVKNLRNRGVVDSPEKIAALLHGAKCCEICGALPEVVGTLHGDHDHKTGCMRGMLCWRCNSGLGNFQDSVERLQDAIKYLVRKSILAESKGETMEKSLD